MLVPTANRIGTDLSLTNLGKSLIKMRKNKGPKTFFHSCIRVGS